MMIDNLLLNVLFILYNIFISIFICMIIFIIGVNYCFIVYNRINRHEIHGLLLNQILINFNNQVYSFIFYGLLVIECLFLLILSYVYV